ncbi:MAG: FAD-dependent oxidoreductase, partial [Streptomyces sp.]|uniref:FAD-dependent oxidoreductase n=1 Tax=Streptomyces sp. TaxID=1931 RepID=UPI003D6A6E53
MHSSDTARTGRSRPLDADVVVVGAGLAGLAAAHHLTGAGLQVIVLEATSRVGGRMATERVDGYLLDSCGRLLCPSWPEFRRLPALDGLELRAFAPGAVLHTDGRTHRIGDLHRTAARHTRTGPAGRRADSPGDSGGSGGSGYAGR